VFSAAIGGGTAVGVGTATVTATFIPESSSYESGGSVSIEVTVVPRVVVLSGSRDYDGTSTVAAILLSITNKVGSDSVNLVSGGVAILSEKGAGTRSISVSEP